MAKFNLYIMRHGHSISNITGSISCKLPGLGLSKNGKEQVKQAAKYFKDKNIGKVYASAFIRTIETAKIICSSLGINDISIDDRVREHDFGTWEGKNGDEMASDLQKHLVLADQGKIDIRFTESGETQREFLSRVFKWLYDLKDQNYNNVLLITHGSPAAILTKLYAQLTFTKQVGGNLKNCEVVMIEIDNSILKGVSLTLKKLSGHKKAITVSS